MQIELTKLQGLVSKSGYKINGASTEKIYADYLSKDFPNSELYWKLLIVPATNRILTDNSQDDITAVRHGVSQELRDIGSYHYSIFLNLVNAHKTLENRQLSSFEQFYFYLGVTCDLVEEFLQRVYFLILDCNSLKSQIIDELTKYEFLQYAEKWYDKNYSTLHEHYFSKGKPNPIRIPNRKYVLDEYFGKYEPWNNYKTVSQRIRSYRNIITHHHKLAFLQDENGNLYIPKHDSLPKYKRWVDVEKVSQESTLIPPEFILITSQISEDLGQIKAALQNLWEKPIRDLTDLLYKSRNQKLLAKYNLVLE